MKQAFMKISLIALAFALVLAGCGGGTTSEQPTSSQQGENKQTTTTEAKDVTLNLRHTQIEERKQVRLALLQDVVNSTIANNPGLTIKMEGVEENHNRNEKLPAEMNAGNPPHIFELFGGDDTGRYVEAGRLLDLTDFLNESGLNNQFLDLDEFTVDGKVYGLPIAGYAMGVYYNKDIFNSLGVSEPKTLNDLINIADKAEAEGYTAFAQASADGWVNGMMFNAIWERHAGLDRIKGLADGSSKFTDPEHVAAFETYASLVNYFSPGALTLEYGQQAEIFMQGSAAMIYDGSWTASRFTDPEQAGDLVGKVGFFSFPDISGARGNQGTINSSYSNGYGFSANVNEDEKQAIYAFIKEFYNEENIRRHLIEDKLIPSIRLSDASGADTLLEGIINALSASKDTYPAWDAVLPRGIHSEVNNVLQEIIGKVSTPEQVAAKLQKEMDELE